MTRQGVWYAFIGANVALAITSVVWTAESRCQSQQRSYRVEASKADGRQVSDFSFDRPWLPCLVKRATAGGLPSAATETEGRDLASQEAAAGIAFWVAVVAFCQLIATIWGLLYIRGSLRATLAAVADTAQATKAMLEANEIAERSSKQSAEAAATDLRAWVTIDLRLDSCGRSEESASIDTTLVLKNLGKTPALQVGVSLNVSVRSSSVVDYGDLPELDKWPMQLMPMMPGQEVEQRIGSFLKKADIEAGIAAARKDQTEPMIVVEGVVYYQTVFDVEDAPKHLTSVQYTMHSTIQWELRKERIAWLDKRGPVQGEVTFNKNKSARVYLT